MRARSDSCATRPPATAARARARDRRAARRRRLAATEHARALGELRDAATSAAAGHAREIAELRDAAESHRHRARPRDRRPARRRRAAAAERAREAAELRQLADAAEGQSAREAAELRSMPRDRAGQARARSSASCRATMKKASAALTAVPCPSCATGWSRRGARSPRRGAGCAGGGQLDCERKPGMLDEVGPSSKPSSRAADRELANCAQCSPRWATSIWSTPCSEQAGARVERDRGAARPAAAERVRGAQEQLGIDGALSGRGARAAAAAATSNAEGIRTKLADAARASRGLLEDADRRAEAARQALAGMREEAKRPGSS